MRVSIRRQLLAAIGATGAVAFLVFLGLGIYAIAIERDARPMDKTSGLLRQIDRIEVQVDDLLTKGDLAVGSDLTWLLAPAARTATILIDDLAALEAGLPGGARKAEVERARRAARQIENLLTRTARPGDLQRPSLDRFDTAASDLVRAITGLREATESELARLAREVEARRERLRLLLALVALLYPVVLLAVWRWTSRAIVAPLRTLERKAKASLEQGDTFTPEREGGLEVASVSNTIAGLVGSLEERVARRTLAVRSHAQNLATEVETRRRTEEALASALDRAERANHAKDEFLAQMSHELRTPLGAVLGYAEMLDGGDLPQDERRQAYGALHRNGTYLLGLISDILTMSETESGTRAGETTEVDLRGLAAELLETVRPEADRTGLELRLTVAPSLPETIETDERGVRQILLNLLSNALKFTEEGDVELELATTASRDAVTLRVRDSGPGIEPEALDRIFDAFFQAGHSNAHGLSGVGLGLAIAQRLAHALGGQLAVESSPGRGTTFELRLPVAAGKASETGSTAALADARSRRERA